MRFLYAEFEAMRFLCFLMRAPAGPRHGQGHYRNLEIIVRWTHSPYTGEEPPWRRRAAGGAA